MIATANPEIQHLLLRLAKYDVELTYLKSKDTVIADALIQVSPLEPDTEDKDNFDVIPVHNITSEIPATESHLEAVRVVTQADPLLSQHKHQVFQGWSDARRNILESIYPFWNYWDELSVENGLIFKTHKFMIPTSQQQEFLKDLHDSHLGEEKILL